MAIRFLGGKPRGGKSLRAVKYLIQELIEGKRHICTNLPLFMDELQLYLIELGHLGINVYDRITVLTKEETQEFYRYRGKGVCLQHRYVMQEQNGKMVQVIDPTESLDLSLLREPTEDEPNPDFPGLWATFGCYYIIDEIHTFFNAHKWKRVSEAALWYASQHGKLGDDVWCISQAIGNVVSQFRNLAQAFHYVRNLRLEKRGMFKAGNGFQEVVYLYAVDPGTDEPPVEGPFSYELDVNGIAACYDTSAGVGVAGGGKADKGKKVKGVPFWALYAGLAAVVTVGWILAGYVPKWLNSAVRSTAGLGPEQKPAPGAKPDIQYPQSSGTVTAEKPLPPVMEPLIPAIAKTPSETVTVRGYVVRGGRANFLMSDGRTLTETGGDIKRVERNYIELTDGRRAYMASPAPRQTTERDTAADSVLAPPRKGRALDGLAAETKDVAAAQVAGAVADSGQHGATTIGERSTSSARSSGRIPAGTPGAPGFPIVVR